MDDSEKACIGAEALNGRWNEQPSDRKQLGGDLWEGRREARMTQAWEEHQRAGTDGGLSKMSGNWLWDTLSMRK